ncbi:MAG: hypothetical protein QXD66_06260 [Candidatus Nezhaarchaeales archaeon]|nr:MAG: hypothetical protein DSO06_01970 [Candidatus Nezhaarchaeota archaeon WYZ-LMO8]
MNWKITVGGLAAVVLLLLAMSVAQVVWGAVLYAHAIYETIDITIPEAHLTNVVMKGGQSEVVIDETTELAAPVIIQEVGSINCPGGQVVNRTLKVDIPSLPGPIYVSAILTFGEASMENVKMEAVYLCSSGGTLNGVNMTVADFPEGMVQEIASATMYNLFTKIFYASIGSLGYTDLEIKIVINIPWLQ